MDIPLFYTPFPEEGELQGPEAYHASKVLRARPGMKALVTNGQGTCHLVTLTAVSSKTVLYDSDQIQLAVPRSFRVRIAIAPTRKPERNEWMLEKLVEFGVDEVSFIKTAHTQLESFGRVVSQERLERIAIAAMKQSRQFFLPRIQTGGSFSDFFALPPEVTRFIAHVPDKSTARHLVTAAAGSKDTIILIGPEGDFSQQEVEDAVNSGYEVVSLGATRLRTETAAVAACHAVHLANLS